MALAMQTGKILRGQPCTFANQVFCAFANSLAADGAIEHRQTPHGLPRVDGLAIRTRAG